MIDQLEILGYVALAMLLAAPIGLERELAKKPAGLRTHMLVAEQQFILAGGTVLLILLILRAIKYVEDRFA